jgi:hypothetical protein
MRSKGEGAFIHGNYPLYTANENDDCDGLAFLVV